MSEMPARLSVFMPSLEVGGAERATVNLIAGVALGTVRVYEPES